MQKKLREWYMAEYPSDSLGMEIDPEVTFEDLFDALDHHRNVYETMGVGDSIIRERLFSELAKIIRADYEYVYNQWLGI